MKHKSKKGKAIAIVTAAVLAFVVGAFVGCGGTKNNMDKTSVREYAAVSAISVLASEPTVTPLRVMTAGASDLTATTKQAMLDNLALVENTLQGHMIRGNVTASDREGYAYGYTLTTTDVTGATKTFLFYYNETTRTEEPGEQVTRYNGIVVHDGVEYTVLGETEVEADEQEQTITVKKDSRNYVVIEQETERGEQSYSYEVISDGAKVLETEISYEKGRGGKVEMEFSIEQNGEEIEYKYEPYSQNNQDYIRVTVEKESGRHTTYEAGIIRCNVGIDGTITYEFV